MIFLGFLLIIFGIIGIVYYLIISYFHTLSFDSLKIATHIPQNNILFIFPLFSVLPEKIKAAKAYQSQKFGSELPIELAMLFMPFEYYTRKRKNKD